MSTLDASPLVARLQERMPAEVGWVIHTLEDAGFPTWAVGGAIRDTILERPGGDWDLATQARPRDVQRIFRRTVPIGVEYGTVGVLGKSGALYEVTTFRRDVETFGRRAVVAFADSIEDDLARRDFTMNAIAWRPDAEVVVDPFDGIDHLAAGRLRTVGEASDRFAEDHLRILRGLRFAGLFGLGIEPDLMDVVRAGCEFLPRLAVERVREELMKVLSGDPVPSSALSLYGASGALPVLFPELSPAWDRAVDGTETGARGWDRAIRVVDELRRSTPLLRLAALLECAEPPAEAVLVRLRFSNEDADRVSYLVRAGTGPPTPRITSGEQARRWLADGGVPHLGDVGELWGAGARVDARDGGAHETAVAEQLTLLTAEVRDGAPLAVGDLVIGGRDLMRAGIPPGPGIGIALRALLDRVLVDPELNEEETLLGILDGLDLG